MLNMVPILLASGLLFAATENLQKPIHVTNLKDAELFSMAVYHRSAVATAKQYGITEGEVLVSMTAPFQQIQTWNSQIALDSSRILLITAPTVAHDDSTVVPHQKVRHTVRKLMSENLNGGQLIVGTYRQTVSNEHFIGKHRIPIPVINIPANASAIASWIE